MAPAAGDGDAQLGELQRRLKAKRAACEQLQEEIAAVRAERDAAKTACMAGVNAAKAQMERMAAELQAIRAHARTRGPEEFPSAEAAEAEGAADFDGTIEEPSAKAARQPPSEDERARLEGLRLQSRLMRHELSKWKHQAEMLESERQGQEREIAYLKAQLTHAHDVLESTRYAVRHHEVERKLREAALLPSAETTGNPDSRIDLRLWQGCDLDKLSLLSGGKGSIEAKAERIIRERNEERASSLSSKAQKLMTVVSSQQHLIERLEKQLHKDEDLLEHRGWQLANASRERSRMQRALRQRSNNVVAAAVGVPGSRKQSSSVPPGRCSDNGAGSARGIAKSSSVSQLPLIDERH